MQALLCWMRFCGAVLYEHSRWEGGIRVLGRNKQCKNAVLGGAAKPS